MANHVLARTLTEIRDELRRLQAKPLYLVERNEVFGVAWKLVDVLEQLANHRCI